MMNFFSGMMFIFMSLLELAVVGFMSRNDGAAPRRIVPLRKSSFENNDDDRSDAWRAGGNKESMPSPRIGLRQANNKISILS